MPSAKQANDCAEPGIDDIVPRVPTWIYVFDLDQALRLFPNPLVIRNVIATNADAMSHDALKDAPPQAAFAGAGEGDRGMNTIERRPLQWWSDGPSRLI